MTPTGLIMLNVAQLMGTVSLEGGFRPFHHYGEAIQPKKRLKIMLIS